MQKIFGIMKRDQIVSRIAQNLRKVAPDAKAILYGSEARGDARPDSDIDVLVILPDNYDTFSQRKIEITESLYDVELATGVSVSPLVVLKSLWERMTTPFTCNVAKEGIQL